MCIRDRLYCNLTVAAVYDVSSVRLQYGPEGDKKTAMYLFSASEISPEGYMPGRFSGQAIKGAFPPGKGSYTSADLIYPELDGSSIASVEDLKLAMRAGEEISVSVFARLESGEDVEILSGKVR